MKLTSNSKKLSKLINQLWKQNKKRDGFAINLTTEIVETLRKDNNEIKPKTSWFIINNNDIPSLYYIENGIENILTIQNYYTEQAIEKIIDILQ